MNPQVNIPLALQAPPLAPAIQLMIDALEPVECYLNLTEHCNDVFTFNNFKCSCVDRPCDNCVMELHAKATSEKNKKLFACPTCKYPNYWTLPIDLALANFCRCHKNKQDQKEKAHRDQIRRNEENRIRKIRLDYIRALDNGLKYEERQARRATLFFIKHPEVKINFQVDMDLRSLLDNLHEPNDNDTPSQAIYRFYCNFVRQHFGIENDTFYFTLEDYSDDTERFTRYDFSDFDNEAFRNTISTQDVNIIQDHHNFDLMNPNFPSINCIYYNGSSIVLTQIHFQNRQDLAYDTMNMIDDDYMNFIGNDDYFGAEDIINHGLSSQFYDLIAHNSDARDAFINLIAEQNSLIHGMIQTDRLAMYAVDSEFAYRILCYEYYQMYNSNINERIRLRADNTDYFYMIAGEEHNDDEILVSGVTL